MVRSSFFSLFLVAGAALVVSSEASLLGCFEDSRNNRVLTGSMTSNLSMTVQRCADICSRSNFYGLENGNECFCGDALTSGVRSNACNRGCSGNGGEICGGADAISLFDNTGGGGAGFTCSNGVVGVKNAKDDVCCELACEACGGRGCDSFGGGSSEGLGSASCCQTTIRSGGASCDDAGYAPCTI